MARTQRKTAAAASSKTGNHEKQNASRKTLNALILLYPFFSLFLRLRISMDSVPSRMVETDLSENSEEENNDEIGSSDGEQNNTANNDGLCEEPKVRLTFDTLDEAFLFYASYAKKKGFGAAKRTSKKKNGVVRNCTFRCSKGGKCKSKGTNPKRPRQQTKTNCGARVNLLRDVSGKWHMSSVILKHNHVFTPGNSKYYESHRVVNESVKRQLILNDKVGIRTYKTYESLQIQAGGYENLTYLEKDLHNLMSRWRNSQNAEGDAMAMFNYFKRMTDDNSDFFYDMDLDENNRLRNVFWADARSRAACKEFGDVVTFDTTYLANTHVMPFAPFVGVNHHGQSVLLGCGLISHEDTESFCWLFKTWMKCMWGCALPAIITDQCMAMKNAIEIIFPNTRHRWCIWHIMKKKSEKLGKCDGYNSFSRLMQNVVYNSLTIDEFEIGWDSFIKEYRLEKNEWLNALYLERKRWVPVFVKDVFWAVIVVCLSSDG
ncbi:hypothetical protein LUZ60_003574 [Juncus effusus]|nr:hypothetical protein LUZ60_003574 [Juncus effusus]